MREYNTEDEQKYNVMIGGILRKKLSKAFYLC